MTEEETPLGTSSVSRNWQTAIIQEVRPFLKLKPGDRIEWVLSDHKVYVRKASQKATK